MTDCTDPADLVEASIDLVATQYRESPRLLALMRAYGVQVAEAFQALCRLPGAFDIDTAVGDQLTIVGKWLGWPRVHPQGARTAVFGFESADCDPCNTINGPVVGGFCYADWAGCAGSEFAPYVFVDDELYRRFLKARVVQLFGDYRRETLTNAIRALFGAPSAMIVTEAPGSIVVSLGRPFEPASARSSTSIGRCCL